MPNGSNDFDDSIGKRIARLRFWSEAKRRLGKDFYRGKHLILTGYRAADVGVLLCMGVKLDNIVAVDRNKVAATSAKLRWPNLNVHSEDVLDVARSYTGDLVTCYADYCANLCSDLLEKTAVIAGETLNLGGILGVTMFAGRENNKAMRKAVLSAKRQQELLGKSSTLSSCTARANTISKTLIRNAKKLSITPKTVPNPLFAHYYQNSSGNPMILWIGQTIRATRASEHSLVTNVKIDLLDGLEETLHVESANMGRGVELLTNTMLRTTNTLLWRRTISAWRAHVTRGTYSK